MNESPVNTQIPPKNEFDALSDAERERVVAAIEQSPPELFVRPFAVAVAERAGTKAKFIEELCYFLAEWFSLLSESPASYLEGIVDFLSSKTDNSEMLRSHWRRILLADTTLGVTLKAFNILSRQANYYEKAVTTTEVRPVYLTDATDVPKHAIVLHQLHITYRTEFGKQTSHIGIDGRSIEELIQVLQRALTKERTLIEQPPYIFLGNAKDAKH